MKKITLSTVKKHIKECKKENRSTNFLGLVENKDLSLSVLNLFYIGNGWDWVNGNSNMKNLIEEIG